MADSFKLHTVQLNDPVTSIVDVTPGGSDVTLDQTSRAIYIQGDGNIAVDTANGETVTVTGLLTGQVYPFRITKVYDTGTTVTKIFSLS